MQAFIRIVAGVGLIITGIIGMFIPVMPQWLFIVPGLFLLSKYIPPLRRGLDWVTQTSAQKQDSRVWRLIHKTMLYADLEASEHPTLKRWVDKLGLRDAPKPGEGK